MVKSVRCALALLFALVAGVVTAQNADPSALFIGVLRADGLLLPVATFSQGEWWNRWPFSPAASNNELKDVRPPASLDAMPRDWLPPGLTLPRRWRVGPAGGAPRDTAVTGLVKGDRSDLVELIGLRTDYPLARGGQVDASDHDNEIAIAVSGRAVTGKFVLVTGAEKTALVPAFTSALEKVEGVAIDDEVRNVVAAAPGPRRAIAVPTRAERQAAILNLTAVRSERQDEGRTLYYLVASKEYHRAGKCELSMDVAAVATRDQNGLRIAPLDPVVSVDCAHDDAITARFVPLATIQWSGPVLWLVKNESEDGFDYGLFDPVKNEQLLLKDRWENRGGRSR